MKLMNNIAAGLTRIRVTKNLLSGRDHHEGPCAQPVHCVHSKLSTFQINAKLKDKDSSCLDGKLVLIYHIKNSQKCWQPESIQT